MTSDLDAVLGAVNGDRMAGTVAALAGAAFTGRRTGSPGGIVARDWLAGRIGDLGARSRPIRSRYAGFRRSPRCRRPSGTTAPTSGG
jgi:hypothetical protein